MQKVLTTRLSDAIIDQLGVDNVLTRRLVTGAVESAVASEEFTSATTAGLRLAHQELLAQLSGEPGHLQVTDGAVVLPFAPFGEALRQRLGAAGVPFVDRLPEVSGGITLFRVDPQLLSSLQTRLPCPEPRCTLAPLGRHSAWLSPRSGCGRECGAR